MLGFASVLRSVDTATIGSYQIEATGRTVGGQAVLIPTVAGDSMQAILDIFQGDSTIEGSPVRLSELAEATTTTIPMPDTTTVENTVENTVEPGSAGELTPRLGLIPRQVGPDDNTIGWVPDPSVICG
jgi:hypothetical protein